MEDVLFILLFITYYATGLFLELIFWFCVLFVSYS